MDSGLLGSSSGALVHANNDDKRDVTVARMHMMVMGRLSHGEIPRPPFLLRRRPVATGSVAGPCRAKALDGPPLDSRANKFCSRDRHARHAGGGDRQAGKSPVLQDSLLRYLNRMIPSV